MEENMDPMRRKLLKELEEMQQTGRMLRNMSMARLSSFDTGIWKPAVDIYESEKQYYVYFDLAGADPRSFTVVADEQRLRVHGRRKLPDHETIACVHRLEIELGVFDRSVMLPGAVDIEGVTSTYTNGILAVILPKRQSRAKVNIEITTGE